MDTNTIQASFIRFQSYDALIQSKIKEHQTLLESNPDDDILREYLNVWIEIHESRNALLPLWNNAVKICDSL